MQPNEQYAAVLHYHDRSKHQINRYARSLGYMDWANQPNPFRIYEGAPQIRLPLIERQSAVGYAALYETGAVAKQRFDLDTIAALLELALGLSAWKKYGQSEWSLRMNPSSGNLHPTECTLLLPELAGYPACIAHYNPLLHCLEVRAELQPGEAAAMEDMRGFGLVLSSICWREAWKYGERAFRYCNHDVGHALGALRFSANLRGLRLEVQSAVEAAELNRLLGFEHTQSPENEHADCLCWVSDAEIEDSKISAWLHALQTPHFQQPPNQLSAGHQSWPIIQEMIEATRRPGFIATNRPTRRVRTGSDPLLESSAEQIIRQRRSAQSYDRPASSISRQDFLAMLERTMPGCEPPFDCLPLDPEIHLVLFAHQVEDLQNGLYLLLRNPNHEHSLRAKLDPNFSWEPVADNLPLYRLQIGGYRALAEQISCQQAIAGDSAFSMAMLSRFEPLLQTAPWHYPRLYWEAGMIGQVLYLEAEARGLRGTGIGCFFDDFMHRLLGLQDHEWQDLYHFTVGAPREDARIQTKPAYYHLGVGADSGESDPR